jgi:hypothetical protein
MGWSIDFDERSHSVVIVAIGPISYEDARAQTEEAVRLMKDHRTFRVLADYSEGLTEVSLANLYWLVDFYKQIEAPSDIRGAVVLPRSGHRIEAYQFHALAARNAGYNIRLFETRADAEKWLTEGGQRIPEEKARGKSLNQ